MFFIIIAVDSKSIVASEQLYLQLLSILHYFFYHILSSNLLEDFLLHISLRGTPQHKKQDEQLNWLEDSFWKSFGETAFHKRNAE